MRISQKSVSRLFKYINSLYHFQNYGNVWIHSEQIAKYLGIKASQVRKDFSVFELNGKRKSGYHISKTIQQIKDLLKKNNIEYAIIAGPYDFAKQLINNFFEFTENLKIAAIFDNNIKSVNNNNSFLPVYPFSHITSFCLENNIKYGIIAYNNNYAQQALDLMILSGVLGILSLSTQEIKFPRSCFVNKINILHEFEKVMFFTKRKAK
jgi:NADH/NAD ratio-sensing transcriptional regulator Rex